MQLDKLSWFLLLAPRDARASSTWRKSEQSRAQLVTAQHATHIHELGLREAAVAIFIEYPPHNIQNVRPQLRRVTFCKTMSKIRFQFEEIGRDGRGKG